MRFGIIVCPKCKRTKAVDLFSKTTKCIGCGRILKLKELRILYRTNSQQELRRALGLINAEMAGKLKDFKNLL